MLPVIVFKGDIPHDKSTTKDLVIKWIQIQITQE